jgi:hypothetical protein
MNAISEYERAVLGVESEDFVFRASLGQSRNHCPGVAIDKDLDCQIIAVTHDQPHGLPSEMRSPVAKFKRLYSIDFECSEVFSENGLLL